MRASARPGRCLSLRCVRACAELVEAAWDPVCVRACVRLRQLLVRACALPAGAPAAARLAAAARSRLAHALQADVFLPPLPHSQSVGILFIKFISL